jgi:RNA exonuclease NGL2
MTENMQSKKPNNIEELKRLKLAKKEAKKRLNAKPQVEQVAPPKVLEREFAIVPDQDMLTTVLGNVRVMTFNVRST